MLALGAAIGTPAARISSNAAGWDGILTATVSKPPVVPYGTHSAFGKIMVKGPGQNRSASSSAASGISLTIPPRSAISAIWRIRGLSEGRPLASYIFFDACASRPFAPRPYTVSVGNATNPPVRRIPAASAMIPCRSPCSRLRYFVNIITSSNLSRTRPLLYFNPKTL